MLKAVPQHWSLLPASSWRPPSPTAVRVGCASIRELVGFKSRDNGPTKKLFNPAKQHDQLRSKERKRARGKAGGGAQSRRHRDGHALHSPALSFQPRSTGDTRPPPKAPVSERNRGLDRRTPSRSAGSCGPRSCETEPPPFELTHLGFCSFSSA
jgi:hypothetical protein